MNHTIYQRDDDNHRAQRSALAAVQAGNSHESVGDLKNAGCFPPPGRQHLAAMAMEYLRWGFSVLPLVGKRPALSSWKEFQARKPTEGEILDWFSGNSTDLNLGIVTGQISDLVVVDADSQEDALWWQETHPASPLTVQTGRGGLHIYYRLGSASLSNRVKLGGRSIDLRADGGYVVAPPSVHPTTAREYAWLGVVEPCLPQALPRFDPTWIKTNVSQMAAHHRGVARDPVAYIRAIRAVSGSGGHNATFRAACVLRDAGISAEEALAILLEWNATNAEPPWSVRELLHKVQDAFRQMK